MSTGSVVLPNYSFKETTRPLMDPDRAIRETISAYLMAQVFRIAPGPDGFVTEFKLRKVFPSWPSAQKDLPYPCASFTSSAPMSGALFVPEGLEDTRDRYGEGTWVWKLDEIDSEYQVDFFVTSDPEREAIASALPRLFAPNDDQNRVWLEGPPEYLSWSVGAMLNSVQRNDQPNPVYSNEYRLTVRVQCSIDVIELRCGTEFSPSVDVEVVQPPETNQDF